MKIAIFENYQFENRQMYPSLEKMRKKWPVPKNLFVKSIHFFFRNKHLHIWSILYT